MGRLSVPLGRIEEALNAERLILANGFSELATILALHPPERPDEVALDPLPS